MIVPIIVILGSSLAYLALIAFDTGSFRTRLRDSSEGQDLRIACCPYPEELKRPHLADPVKRRRIEENRLYAKRQYEIETRRRAKQREARMQKRVEAWKAGCP